MVLRIGVISDLHCHSLINNDNKKDSYLTDIELPKFQDPYKSFIHLIESGIDLSVDILVMTGDFANRACPFGLNMGYQITKDINKLMNSKLLISNIGNHDVDSRNLYEKDPLKNLYKLDAEFPFAQEANNNEFWKNGFTILEYDEYRIVVINTSHNHTSPANTDHGDISEESLNLLEQQLEKYNDQKIGIVITHHCPIEHSHYNSGVNDFMHNGDELSKIIDKFNFSLLIHGHKHDPRIRSGQGGVNSPFIFSAGSFSAVREKLLLGGTNTFHIVNINLDGEFKGKGSIETWFFFTSKGWQKNIKNPYFDTTVGFGAFIDLNVLSNEIIEFIKTEPNNTVEWNTLVERMPSIKYLIPSDLEKLKAILKTAKIKTSSILDNGEFYLQLKNLSI